MRNYSLEEVGNELKLTPQQVKVYAYRAKQRILKDILNGSQIGEV